MGKPQIVYAEITSEQLRQIEIDGTLQFCFPSGVTMNRKWGSKGFTLACDDEQTSDILLDGLEDTGLSWQTMEEFPLPEVEPKQPKKYRGKGEF